MLTKNKTAGPFAPTYIGDYRIVSIKGYQVEIMPSHDRKTKTVHISDVKYMLHVDNVRFKCWITNSLVERPNYD